MGAVFDIVFFLVSWLITMPLVIIAMISVELWKWNTKAVILKTITEER